MPRVSVIVTSFNDAEHVVTAVRSALAQGAEIGEVVVVDDASTDGTPQTLAAAFGDEPRVRVVRRATRSGGCGTPRNDGIAAAAFPYLFFLDSGDELAPGAAGALLAAADWHVSDVTAGRSVRRELPEGRETVWAPEIYGPGATFPGTLIRGVTDHPAVLKDTLSVNKLYRAAFLRDRSLRYPEGAPLYGDSVFTARVYAAGPRIAYVDAPVHVRNVRRAATAPVAPRGDDIGDWRDLMAAHRDTVRIFREASATGLALAAQAKFLDHDLPAHARQLPQRSPQYVTDWWQATREYVTGFDRAALELAAVPSRWMVRALTAPGAQRPEPGVAGVGRLVELAALPPRLIPPYGQTPPPELAELEPRELPAVVDARVQVGSSARIALRVHDLYGRLAALHPVALQVRLTDRDDPEHPVTVQTPLVGDGDGWTATVQVPTTLLGRTGRLAIWHIRAEIRYAGTAQRTPTEVRAADGQPAGRGVVVRRTGRVLLVQTHITGRRALVLRVADGVAGARQVLGARLRRLRLPR
ncbi:glycosyltransferase family 2 protein [Streptomyces sp. NPDC021020]|uniref:glycosyltransferase family 2 protein n=1 Tax=Streptomyces sp. NPDC021020 TaxID=3365109 RepID=UPI00378E9486